MAAIIGPGAHLITLCPLPMSGLPAVCWVKKQKDVSEILSTQDFCWALSSMKAGLGLSWSLLCT